MNVSYANLGQGLVEVWNTVPGYTPIEIAILQLSHFLDEEDLVTRVAASSNTLVRVEMRICPSILIAETQQPGAIPVALLLWLRLQDPTTSNSSFRAAFASRCADFGFAGLGVCDQIAQPLEQNLDGDNPSDFPSSPAPTKPSATSHNLAPESGLMQMKDRLQGLHPKLRYVGGCRFTPEQAPHQASKWPAAFGAFCYVLPRVEIALTAQGDADPLYASMAVHLKLDAGEGSKRLLDVRREVKAAVEQLRCIRWPGAARQPTLPRLLPAPCSVTHIPTFSQYAGNVQHALEQFQTQQLQKVVLARQTVLAFGPHTSQCFDSIDVLLSVWMSRVDKHRYLFFFEPPPPPGQGTLSCPARPPAFMSISPESLCRVQGTPMGSVVETEATAGTWSTIDFESLGLSEHIEGSTEKEPIGGSPVKGGSPLKPDKTGDRSAPLRTGRRGVGWGGCHPVCCSERRR